MHPLNEGEDLGPGKLGARAGGFHPVERGESQVDRQGVERDDAAGGTGTLQGARIRAGHRQILPRQGEDVRAVDAFREVEPSLGGVGRRILEDVDELEPLAERARAPAQLRGHRSERRLVQQKQLGQQLAHDAGHHVAVLLQVGHVVQPQLAGRVDPCHKAGHPPRGARRVRGDQLDRPRREREECIEHRRHLGQQLAVRRLLAGDLFRPAPGECLGGRGVGVLHQTGERLEGLHPQLARPGGGVLERVGDPEEEIRERHLTPHRLGKQGNGEGEGAAGGDQELFQIDFTSGARARWGGDHAA